MNRREVIAITVIINVVLLSVLFFTAQRLEEDSFDQVIASVNSSSEKPLPPPPVAVPLTPAATPSLTSKSDVPVDEVDTVLRDFAAAVAASQQQQQQQTRVQEQVYTPPPPPVQAPIQQPLLPSVSPTASHNMVEVVVKKGDFLQRIAKQNSSTVEAIKLANNMKNDQLKVGQVLRVPILAAQPAEKPQTIPTYPQGNTYKVKSGDSPWKIAKQHNVSLDELLHLNNLDEESAKNLKPGDIIRVP